MLALLTTVVGTRRSSLTPGGGAGLAGELEAPSIRYRSLLQQVYLLHTGTKLRAPVCSWCICDLLSAKFHQPVTCTVNATKREHV